jgi:hypothetical protein
VDGLEQVFVAMHRFAGRLLQCQELIGPQIPLVVGTRRPRQYRLASLFAHHLSIAPTNAQQSSSAKHRALRTAHCALRTEH